ncbi:MAG: holo-ACP synthase [Armatimonadota bacterium]
MIIGVGVDIVKVERIERMVKRYGRRFTRKIYTDDEVAACERRQRRLRATTSFEEYAARWAAKEAVMKALGTGWRQGVTFRDIENYNLPSGKPMVRLHGRAREIAGRLGGKAVHVSISHEREFAIAFVVLEG